MPSFLEPPEKMPPASAKVYGYLAGEILRTRAKWIYYRQLFMDSELRVKKLSRAGSDFFGELQNILTNDLILSLSRLTDPARTGHHENLTVALMVELIKSTVVAPEFEASTQDIALRTSHERSGFEVVRRVGSLPPTEGSHPSFAAPAEEMSLDSPASFISCRAGIRGILPNKAPEPTRTSVTPRADARVAPAARVAHL